MSDRRLGKLLGATALLMAGALGFPPSDALAQGAVPAQQAPAKTSVDIEVLVLHATNRDAGASIDPSIGNLPALKLPPFSAYNTYTLISRLPFAVAKTAPITTTLPNTRTLKVAYSGPDGARHKIATSINEPGGTTFMPLLEVTVPLKETFFVAGQSYQGGILVIGITVLK